MNVLYRKQLGCLLLIIAVFFYITEVSGQSAKPAYEELRVGEKMPDISLGTVVNNVTGKKRFTDFKGKLMILDFWTTGCSSCIKFFPHMADLQKKFGDKIQIFLVNPWETEEQINERLKESPIWKNRTDLFPANLPVLAGLKQLGDLFPVKVGVPYHVWIDGEGIVRLRGHFFNTTEKKIAEILAGKEVSFVKDGNLGTKIPLYKSASNVAALPLKFATSLTGYIDSLGNHFGGPILSDQVDSFSQTICNTYINTDVLTLYQEATKELVELKNTPSIIKGERFILLVKDTLKYMFDINSLSKTTDEIFTKSKFCYEQITPWTLSVAQRRQSMLQDLNRYFGMLYGTEGKVELRRLPCWILVRTSKIDKFKRQSVNKIQGITQEEAYKKNMNWFADIEFKSVMVSFFTDLFAPTSTVFSQGDIIIDETGYSGNMDIVYPRNDIKSIDDIRNVLRKYDLDIVKGEREFNVLVIEEKNN